MNGRGRCVNVIPFQTDTDPCTPNGVVRSHRFRGVLVYFQGVMNSLHHKLTSLIPLSTWKQNERVFVWNMLNNPLYATNVASFALLWMLEKTFL